MTNNKFQEFHEKETVVLKASKLMPLLELRACLGKLGFGEIDDFFSIKRTDIIYPWQFQNNME